MTRIYAEREDDELDVTGKRCNMSDGLKLGDFGK
jgi:hypothetical protein